MFEANEEMDKCNDPKHNPPMGYNYESSGVWVCPSCGAETVVNVTTPKL